MSLTKTFQKAAAERLRLYIDYSCWLETTETLADTQMTITPLTPDTPIVVTTGFTDVTNKKLVMYVSGGAANQAYVLSLQARTNEGQIKVDNIGLKVTQ